MSDDGYGQWIADLLGVDSEKDVPDALRGLENGLTVGARRAGRAAAGRAAEKAFRRGAEASGRHVHMVGPEGVECIGGPVGGCGPVDTRGHLVSTSCVPACTPPCTPGRAGRGGCGACTPRGVQAGVSGVPGVGYTGQEVLAGWTDEVASWTVGEDAEGSEGSTGTPGEPLRGPLDEDLERRGKGGRVPRVPLKEERDFEREDEMTGGDPLSGGGYLFGEGYTGFTAMRGDETVVETVGTGTRSARVWATCKRDLAIVLSESAGTLAVGLLAMLVALALIVVNVEGLLTGPEPQSCEAIQRSLSDAGANWPVQGCETVDDPSSHR